MNARDEAQFPAVSEARLAEAMALFTAGEARALQSERALALAFVIVAAGLAGATTQPAVLLVVPPLVALVLVFFLHSSIHSIVMGMARLRLEQALDEDLGAPSLIYESTVAQLRHGPEAPRPEDCQVAKRSTRDLLSEAKAFMLSGIGASQVLVAAILLGLTGSGLYGGMQLHGPEELWALIAYGAVMLVAAWALLRAYVDMGRCWELAREKVNAHLQLGDAGPN